MERAKKKRLYHLRVVTTNILMGISVVVIAGILTLLAMGYNFSKNGLERSGLLQVRSHPSSATVEINGETQSSRTEIRKMLSEGNYEIVVTKSGYGVWNTTVNIEAGLLTRIDWVRLFPLKRTVETVHKYNPTDTGNTLRHVSTSPDKNYLAIIHPDSKTGATNLQIIDIRTDEVKYNNIPFANILGATFAHPGDPSQDSFRIAQWSTDNSKFILRWTMGGTDTSTWILVDITKPENSILLDQKFMMNFTSLQIANPAGTKIWALENGNLRLINTNDITISAVLVSSVEKISTSGNVVGFIGKNPQEERIVGIYQEGERGSTTIEQIPDDTTHYTVAIGNNWVDKWLAYTLDTQLVIHTGNYPSFQSSAKMKATAARDLEFTPTTLTASPSHRFVVASSANQIASFDIEIKQLSKFDFPGSTINWLDNFILWTDQDDALTIIDFNGGNRRELCTVAPGFNLALTANNRWLYFIVPQPDDESGFLLQRERL